MVLDPQNASLKALFSKIKPESVLSVSGVVKERIGETVNEQIATGSIEVHASDLVVHNVSKTPPFPMDSTADKVGEELRMTYRYLDLRRRSNLDILRLRHKTSQVIRNYLDSVGFTEVKRLCFLRVHLRGRRVFSAFENESGPSVLPQSPQQYKQMLMVAGIEKYYQLARCFRDEDLRADRQPEFTQLDIELSFIDREDMYALIEGLMADIWKRVLGVEINTPFLRLSYFDAMNRFGVDKPDMRFGLELVDCNSIFKESTFKVFSGVIQSIGSVKAFNAKEFGRYHSRGIASTRRQREGIRC